MKRWIAGMLAVILLLLCGPAAAQDAMEQSDAEIQESMETREGERLGTLTENLGFLVRMLQDEDIQRLVKTEDVQALMNEGIAKLLVWMLQNRPVTMKILKEFGVGDRELRCIEIIWDSADRMAAAWSAYAETEDGKGLIADYEALKNDEAFITSVEHFFLMITDNDFSQLLDALMETLREAKTDAEGTVIDEAVTQQREKIETVGALIGTLLKKIKDSAWAQDLVPLLTENEHLQRLIEHLSNKNEADDIVIAELRDLAENRELADVIKQGAQGVVSLMKAIKGEWKDTKDNQTISEEAAP